MNISFPSAKNRAPVVSNKNERKDKEVTDEEVKSDHRVISLSLVFYLDNKLGLRPASPRPPMEAGLSGGRIFEPDSRTESEARGVSESQTGREENF